MLLAFQAQPGWVAVLLLLLAVECLAQQQQQQHLLALAVCLLLVWVLAGWLVLLLLVARSLCMRDCRPCRHCLWTSTHCRWRHHQQLVRGCGVCVCVMRWWGKCLRQQQQRQECGGW